MKTPLEIMTDLTLDTFPKLLLERARRHPDKVAMREKELGIWQEWSWRQIGAEVRALACGLAQQGLRRGDKVAIVGDNRPHLYWAMVAVQCLGGVPVPLYQDAVAEELQFVLDHAEVRFAIVEDQEQVDKLLAIWDRCPTLDLLIYEEPRGITVHPFFTLWQRFKPRAASSMSSIRIFSNGKRVWAQAVTWPSSSIHPERQGGPKASCYLMTT
jgi:long-subunit acyl-CoA synthetase (AMP-forming)